MKKKITSIDIFTKWAKKLPKGTRVRILSSDTVLTAIADIPDITFAYKFNKKSK